MPARSPVPHVNARLSRALDDHARWLDGRRGGRRFAPTGLRLVGANLRRAGLRRAALGGADLRGAILDGADMTGCYRYPARRAAATAESSRSRAVAAF